MFSHNRRLRRILGDDLSIRLARGELGATIKERKL
jgi:hypothetical protein